MGSTQTTFREAGGKMTDIADLECGPPNRVAGHGERNQQVTQIGTATEYHNSISLHAPENRTPKFSWAPRSFDDQGVDLA
jgi:hypothetical protein